MLSAHETFWVPSTVLRLYDALAFCLSFLYAHVRLVSSGDDASVLGPLSRLPWLLTVAAHGETREDSSAARGVLNRHQRGVLNRHQRGVARGDAAFVIESLGAAERPARTAGTLVPGVPRYGHALHPGRSHVKENLAPLRTTVGHWSSHSPFL